jgi:hypothetical protein
LSTNFLTIWDRYDALPAFNFHKIIRLPEILSQFSLTNHRIEFQERLSEKLDISRFRSGRWSIGLGLFFCGTAMSMN